MPDFSASRSRHPSIANATWFAPKPRIAIGRLHTCDIVIDEKTISGQHAQVSRRAGLFYVTDLRSTNGTFLNQASDPIGKGASQKLRDLKSQIEDVRNQIQQAERAYDLNKAADLLKEKGVAKAAKKSERVTAHGLAETYVHTGGRVAAAVSASNADVLAGRETLRECLLDAAGLAAG